MVTNLLVSAWHLLELGIPHSCALNSQTEMGRCYPRYPVVVGTGDGKKKIEIDVELVGLGWVESIRAWKYHHFCHPAFLWESHTHAQFIGALVSGEFVIVLRCSSVCIFPGVSAAPTHHPRRGFEPWRRYDWPTGCLSAWLTDSRKRGFPRKNFSCVNPAVRRCSKIHLHEKEFEKKFTYKRRISRSQSLPWMKFANCNSSFILILSLSLLFP